MKALTREAGPVATFDGAYPWLRLGREKVNCSACPLPRDEASVRRRPASVPRDTAPPHHVYLAPSDPAKRN